jgi:hypothetical protein
MKDFSNDLVKLLAVVKGHEGVGGDVRGALLESLEHPSSSTISKALVLLEVECERLSIKTGAHSLVRLQDMVQYLSKSQLDAVFAVYNSSISDEPHDVLH